jgi:ATP-dependent helicase Lhr and Lhr-like helicase
VRVPGNHLVFRGPEFVMASRRQGRDLTFYAPPADDELALFLAPLRHLISRRVDPLPRVSIEQVNGVPVRESENGEALLQSGFRNAFKSFVLSASYR